MADVILASLGLEAAAPSADGDDGRISPCLAGLRVCSRLGCS